MLKAVQRALLSSLTYKRLDSHNFTEFLSEKLESIKDFHCLSKRHSLKDIWLDPDSTKRRVLLHWENFLNNHAPHLGPCQILTLQYPIS